LEISVAKPVYECKVGDKELGFMGSGIGEQEIAFFNFFFILVLFYEIPNNNNNNNNNGQPIFEKMGVLNG
jgi:hypothetical protein